MLIIMVIHSTSGSPTSVDGLAGAGVLLYAKSHRQVDFQLRLEQPLEASQVPGLLFLKETKVEGGGRNCCCC